MTRIQCSDCNGSGIDTAGHNFAYSGGNFACENCEGQGGWEAENDTISTQSPGEYRKLYANPFGTETHGDPMLKRRRAA